MSRSGTTFGEEEDMLILAKTYPLPSEGSVETTCVAAISASGELRRVFPVPFRLLPPEKQFDKWQWIRAKFRSPTDDHRPESRRIDSDSLSIGAFVSTGKDRLCSERLQLIQNHIVPSMKALRERRVATQKSLGIIKPSRITRVELVDLPLKERDWTDAEKEKLTKDTEQGDLFFAKGTDANKRRKLLQKLPFKMYYHYEIDTDDGVEINKTKVTDWEAGALYLNCLSSHGEDWKTPFLARYETEFKEKDIHFVMGTVHRYPQNWLIISVIYPPKKRPVAPLSQGTFEF